MPHGPHDSREHPWGGERQEGDPAGDALAGKEGGKSGAVLGAWVALREPPPPPSPMQQRVPRGGLGAGAGGAPGAWQTELAATQGMLDAGSALGGEPSPRNRRVTPSPVIGGGDGGQDLASDTRRRRESRAGGGAGGPREGS